MGSGNPSKSHMGGMGVGALKTFTHPSLNPSFFFHTLLPQIQLKTCKNLSLPPSFFFVHLSSQFYFSLSLFTRHLSLTHTHFTSFLCFRIEASIISSISLQTFSKSGFIASFQLLQSLLLARDCVWYLINTFTLYSCLCFSTYLQVLSYFLHGK